MHQANIITCEPNSAEWLQLRRQGIGGSDCAAALGKSRWKSPYQLYLEKRGEAETVEETWDMKRGKALEPLLRQHYADTTGREVMTIKGIAAHPKYEFIRYTPDGFTSDGRLQEFKTARSGKEWGDAGSDEIPQEYLLQVQHGMLVFGFAVADVTVSIGGSVPQYFEVPADKELHEMITEDLAKFWEMVRAGTPPEPSTAEDVAKRYPIAAAGTGIAANDDIMAIWHTLKEVRTEIGQREEEEESLMTTIKCFMGESDTLLFPEGGVAATWKQAKGAARIDSKALRAQYPDIADQFTTIGEPTRRFILK